MARSLLQVLTLLLFIKCVFLENNRGVSRPVCDIGSCHPQTGNLLIGRADKLTASSTCGLNGPVSYCIVSHLEGKGKNCFQCDSRPEANPNYSHRIENVIYHTEPGTDRLTWWQSENGKEDVSIQLDLEAEFHFTHLIMKFRTFKPAAMLVERSSDFGKTWKVYRYFAEKCEVSFPNITRTRQKHLTDVVCDSNYFNIDPSTEGGEVILRIISPSLQRKRNPYTDELQELLKMTNLRVNFTKLFTLGDDLLDKRQQIQEKYYYAITEMTVRGSCWCYGHAERCLPENDDVRRIPDMVYGKCDCTHHTTGLNCQKCKPTHRDHKWKPATGIFTNACKKCICNEHAETCEFDEGVFNRSGHVSGSVCIDCLHNTIGNNCEKCKPFYYHDPALPITDPNTCLRCSCDPDGTVDGGLCDSQDAASNTIAGQCHCKKNVMGRDCDQCKPGFWNLDPSNPDGCEACTCSPAGTQNVTSCNPFTGVCKCKENVTGKNCDQCISEHWGLSEETNGCKPCDCDIGGALDSNCDVITGQCKCRPHITGTICDKPEQSYYVPQLDVIFEAEDAICSQNCLPVERQPPKGIHHDYTGTGHMRLFDKSELEFTLYNLPTSGEHDTVLRYQKSEYEWADVSMELKRPGPVDPMGVCANAQPADDFKRFQLRSDTTYLIPNGSICLERGKEYKMKLIFKSDSNQVEAPSASILIDSIAVIPRVESIPFFHGSPKNDLRKAEYLKYRCNEAFFSSLRESVPDICKKYHYSIAVNIYGGAYECRCDLTGSKSALCNEDGGACDCKTNVEGRKCDRCTSGTYGFSPEGCLDCDCDWVGALDNLCDVESGQCSCKNGTYGRSCSQCEPGSWNFPNCKHCQCHGHAYTCDSATGRCDNCADFTTGHNCDQCAEGFYGEPTDPLGLPCKACRCPNTVESGHSFASTCVLNSATKDVQCLCNTGYSGSRCDKCADNYYGNPEVVGGSCEVCQCNDNTDLSVPGNCDPHTGECLRCLYNTAGFHCDVCQPNFFGDALKQQCYECSCDLLGTDKTKGPCNGTTGHCPCLPNVEGVNCEMCKEDYWGIARGTGCIPCDCDPVGSLHSHCNEFTGECSCRDGFGGQKCNQCQQKFWGNPNLECFPCLCNEEGSVDGHCEQDTGNCYCKEGIGGEKCDVCARGYNGSAPYCTECGECFNNWNLIIENLSAKTDILTGKAGDIKRTGATGAYNSDFDDMTKNIIDVNNTLLNTKLNKVELDSLNIRIDSFRNSALNSTMERVNRLGNSVQNVISVMSIASLSLSNVNEKAQNVKTAAISLNDNATHLQEKDLKGALNLTREAGDSSKKVSAIERSTSSLLAEADRQCKRTENLINKDNDQFTMTEQKNENLRQNLEFILSRLDRRIPDLNNKICDKRGDPCDDHCGGAGCDKCGGLSCTAGAVGKIDGGISISEQTNEDVSTRLKNSGMLYRQISSAKLATEAAKDSAGKVHKAANDVKNEFESVVFMMSEMNKNLDLFIKTAGASPAEIRNVANEALNLNIQLKPQKIKELADRINETIASLPNMNAILEDTKYNQTKADGLKQRSDEARNEAEKILEKAQKVVEALKAAKEAQEEAEVAINTAHQDITATKKYLKQIGSETSEADLKANNTNQEIQSIKSRLKELQTEVLKNAEGAKRVSLEAGKIADQVKNSKGEMLELNMLFNHVNNTVQKRSDSSSNSKLRAQILLEKARQLSVNTTAKLKELKDADTIYNEQDKKLANITGRIEQLTLTVGSYIEVISKESERYRNCN